MSGKNLDRHDRVDRRSARTQRLLHQALMQLILRKNYESITVQDLLDEADIGRSTFYAHYAGKDDLLRRGFERLRAELGEVVQKRGDKKGPALAFSLPMFVHANRYKEIYGAMLGSAGNGIVLSEIRRVLLGHIQPDVSARPDKKIPHELMVRYVIDVFHSVLTWWLERHPELEPEAVDTLFRRLVVPTLQAS